MNKYYDTEDMDGDIDGLYDMVDDLYSMMNKAEFFNRLLAVGSKVNEVCKKLAVDL